MCEHRRHVGVRSRRHGAGHGRDLRGYGRSKDQRGDFTLREAAGDVLELGSALGHERFAIVGHSMSTLVALHLAQHHADRIERAVVITPAPPAFELMFRAYAPTKELFEKTWVLPDVEKLR